MRVFPYTSLGNIKHISEKLNVDFSPVEKWSLCQLLGQGVDLYIAQEH